MLLNTYNAYNAYNAYNTYNAYNAYNTYNTYNTYNKCTDTAAFTRAPFQCPEIRSPPPSSRSYPAALE